MTDADWNKIDEELEEPEDKAAREEAIAKAQRKQQGGGIDMDALNAAQTEEERQKILKAAGELFRIRTCESCLALP